MDSLEILRADKSIKLKAKEVQKDFAELFILPTPAMFMGTDGKWRVLGRVGDGKALISEVPHKQTTPPPSSDGGGVCISFLFFSFLYLIFSS